MKKHLVGSVNLKTKIKNCDYAVVEYFRTQTEEGDERHNPKRPVGIEVVKKEELNGVTYREIKTITHIGNNIAEVDSILKTLCKNRVTPVCVADVLEDLMVI